MAVIKTYDTTRYPFSTEIARIFQVAAGDLHLLHAKRPELLPQAPLTISTETRTKFHDLILDDVSHKSASVVWNVYINFIRDVVSPFFDREFVYQAFPTFRLQLPGEMAIHEWHYDSDSNHLHPDWEINFQVALTDVWGSRATWIESVPGLRDFAPMEMTVGQFAIFNGNKCMHGNKRNDTGFTRASLDFRVLPWDRYTAQTTTRTSFSAGRRFVVGEYYERFQH